MLLCRAAVPILYSAVHNQIKDRSFDSLHTLKCVEGHSTSYSDPAKFGTPFSYGMQASPANMWHARAPGKIRIGCDEQLI